MVHAIILAAGVGQRMRNGGLPKQFLKLMGKPIIIYTLEKFEENDKVDDIVIVCHGSYVDHMNELIRLYALKKVKSVVVGGSDRQDSLTCGLEAIKAIGGKGDDVVIIHDGVRPLVSQNTINENIRIAAKYGCAATVHPVTETVVITDEEEADMEDFKKRSDTYSMTAPQSFKLENIIDAYARYEKAGSDGKIPLLDAAMVYSQMGGKVYLVKEQGVNLKITTPEDFYYLKAILELEENKYIFGL